MWIGVRGQAGAWEGRMRGWWVPVDRNGPPCGGCRGQERPTMWWVPGLCEKRRLGGCWGWGLWCYREVENNGRVKGPQRYAAPKQKAAVDQSGRWRGNVVDENWLESC